MFNPLSPGLFAVSLFSLAIAVPSPGDVTVVRDSRSAPPAGFINSGPAPSSQQLNFRIGLVSTDAAGLEAKVYDVSTPSSASYGQHLTVDEVNSYLSPTQDTVNAVNGWLSLNGLNATSASPSGDWISLTVSVSEANKLFKASYNVFTHKASGKQLTRTLSYSLPSNLTSHIDAVHPTTSFDLLLNPGPVFKTLPSSGAKKQVNSRDTPAVCDPEDVTPACVLALYDIPASGVKANKNLKTNHIGVTGFSEEYANKADLSTFLQAHRPDMNPNTTFAVESISGGADYQDDPGLEANLDTQYTVGIANGVPVSFLSVGNSITIDQFIGSFIDLNSYLLRETNRPQVITTSYGWDESAVSNDLNNKICLGFAALGAVGTSVVFASGDGGVAGGHGEECTLFPPAWPVGCPFLTSVGATQGFPETGAAFSSGGFSNHFLRPIYQFEAVPSYLAKLGQTYSGLFNRSGRAYPDVAAIGVDVEITWFDEFGTVDGTSCSSPIFAAVIGLINGRLAEVGRPPLGFLNPFLYAHPEAFNDITAGSNPGCNTGGFNATKGWDPITGLGTPKFPALLKAAGLR